MLLQACKKNSIDWLFEKSEWWKNAFCKNMYFGNNFKKQKLQEFKS